MKLLITNLYPPWKIGGVQKVISEYSDRLSERNKINVICCGRDGYVKNWNNIVVTQIKKSYTPLNLSLIAEIKKISKSYDLVHAHNFSNTMPFYTYLGIKNKPFIVSPHYHPTASNFYLGLIKSIYDPIVNYKILEKADKILCVSNFEKETLIKKFKINQNKLCVIYNGVNIDKIRSYKPYDIDYKAIVSVGRLEKYKNIQLVVRSMKYLKEDVKLIIIGEGDYKQNLMNVAKSEGVMKKVKFLGKIPENDLFSWLNTSCLLVNLSSIEAFGISVLEGLAAGCRAIVNNCMGLKELAGIFNNVEAINIMELSDRQIAEIIEENLYKRFQIDDSLRKFDWNYISTQYELIYKEALENRNIY